MASPRASELLEHYFHDGITPSKVISTGIALLLVYVLGSTLYTSKFHPLASFPGPALAALSRIPWWLSCLTGNQVSWIQQLHARYGPVVRFSPNDLSFADDQNGDVWKEIHAFEKGREEYAKAKEWFPVPLNGVPNILRLEYDDHRRVRQCFSPAFSDRALKKQEGLFQTHADLLVSAVGRVAAAQGEHVDMVLLYNMASFDIMANFTFGQPLGMLENMELSPWVEGVFESVKVWPIVQIIQYYPILEALFPILEPKFVRTMRKNHFSWTVDRVDKRLRDGSDQPDLWNLVLSAEKHGRGLSLDEMHNNAELLMIAGSETTATLMAGLTYYLLVNPDKLHSLTEELRNTFTSLIDITMESTANLKYLNACIQEALRLYPPIPINVPRVVPRSGRTISGRWIAPGTRVSVSHYTTYRYAGNFANAEAFAPERWLGGDGGGDPVYKDDKRKCLQPFAVGPRNCLGQNMAMHEMRILLAKVFWRFDLEVDGGSVGWIEQKNFALWEKGPLRCRVKVAETEV